MYIRAQSIQSCFTPRDPIDCILPDSSVHGDSPGKNTGVGYYALFWGIFPTQGSNPCLLWLLHCWRILYHWDTGEASLSLLLSLCVCVCVCVCIYVYIYIKHVLSIYKHFLIHSSNSQHLDCFCTLAVINNILFYILVSPSYIATHSAL